MTRHRGLTPDQVRVIRKTNQHRKHGCGCGALSSVTLQGLECSHPVWC